METTASVPDSTASDRPSCGWLVLITLGNFLAHLFCVLAIVVAVGMCPGSVVIHFDNVDAELPGITQTTIDWYRFVVGYWYLFAPLLVLDALVFVLFATRSARWRWTATFYSMLILLVTISLIVFVTIGLTLPFTRLVEGTV